jgi:phosphomannomutase
VCHPQQAVKCQIAELEEYGQREGATIDTTPRWCHRHFRLVVQCTAQNTEPLLRLNVEGDTKELMEKGRDEALAIIQEKKSNSFAWKSKKIGG